MPMSTVSKRPGECAVQGCVDSSSRRELPYWPGGMRETRGARPVLPICGAHWSMVQSKMADGRHWRAVYSMGVLSFRTTGVAPGS